MNLGLILSPGDSLTKQQKSGQLNRLINYYLKPYSKNFKKVYLFSYGDFNFKTKLPSNIKIIPKPKLIPYQFYQFFLPLIHQKIIRDINIFRVFQAIGGLPMLLIKKPFLVTYGYHYHQFAQVEKMPIKAQLIKLFIKPVLKKAGKIIATSKENKNYLTKEGYQSKVHLIPNGVDPKKFKPDGKRDTMTVLSIGRLTYQKNHPLLIKTIGQSKYRSKIKLNIIGQGSLKSKIKNLASKLKVNLTIFKPISHQKLVKHYQKASVFVLTSKTEGQSKALLEAMSAGCACLTTSFPGNIIIDGQTGLIANSPKILAAKLDSLLKNPQLCQQLGKKARETIIQQYHLKKLVLKEIKLLLNYN